MNEAARIRLIVSGIVATAYGVAWTVDAIIDHKKRKEQKKYDVEFLNIVKNF